MNPDHSAPSPDAREEAPAGPEPLVEDADAFEEALGYRFERPDLLRLALTHRSYSNERGEDDNYERLEFLGDSVLGLIASHWLFDRFPARAEGELAKIKGFLVSTRALSRLAEELGLGALVRLGVGEQRSGGHAKTSILADAMEAVFGAVYLDGGLEAARGVILPVLERILEERGRRVRADAKTSLQEQLQGRGWSLPVYRLLRASGPDHRKMFTVECLIRGRVAGKGEGRSKKRAEQAAAAAALAELDLARGEP